jgi:hypothetical protein
MEALQGLYARLMMLLDEMMDGDMLFRLSHEEGVYAGSRDEPDPVGRRHTLDIQTARLRDAQKPRLSLPPLPRFPDEGVSPRDEPESIP